MQNNQQIPLNNIQNKPDITNHPSINNVELTGNKTLEDLGIQPKGNYLTEIPSDYITETELNEKNFATVTQLNNKLDQNFGTDNSGKVLVVSADGTLTYTEVYSKSEIDQKLQEFSQQIESLTNNN